MKLSVLVVLVVNYLKGQSCSIYKIVTVLPKIRFNVLRNWSHNE